MQCYQVSSIARGNRTKGLSIPASGYLVGSARVVRSVARSELHLLPAWVAMAHSDMPNLGDGVSASDRVDSRKAERATPVGQPGESLAARNSPSVTSRASSALAFTA